MEVTKLLLEEGANPNTTGQVTDTCRALRGAHCVVVQRLTSSFSPSQQYSVYPIIWAAGRGHADIVKLLLENGAKVNCSDKVVKKIKYNIK